MWGTAELFVQAEWPEGIRKGQVQRQFIGDLPEPRENHNERIVFAGVPHMLRRQNGENLWKYMKI